MILYIHGFGSHGYGSKAKQFREYFASIKEEFIAPSLSYVPELAIQTLEELIKSYHGDVYLIGSSLGGFYSTYLSQLPEVKKVVLINPATKPMETLSRALGDAPNFYDDSSFSWKQEHLQMLEKYDYYLPHGSWELQKFFVLLQKGDELLDYKDAKEKYDGAEVIIEDAGSHSFDNIERHFENIRAFFAVGKQFKHTTKVKGVGFELDELAKRTGDLYYDNLAHFLEKLSQKIESDAKADKARGREKLAKNLFKSASLLQQSSREIEKAWQVCEVATLNWMLENGFNKDDLKIGILTQEIADEFARRTRWDIASMVDHDSRDDLANFDDDFVQELLGVFEDKGRAYMEYLKAYLKVIAYSDFVPNELPNSKEFIEEKCKRYGFLDEFDKYYLALKPTESDKNATSPKELYSTKIYKDTLAFALKAHKEQKTPVDKVLNKFDIEMDDDYIVFYSEDKRLILDKNHKHYLKTFKAINRLNEYLFERYNLRLFKREICDYDWANREKDGIKEYKNRVGISYIIEVLNSKDLLDLNKQTDEKIDRYFTTILEGEDVIL